MGFLRAAELLFGGRLSLTEQRLPNGKPVLHSHPRSSC